MIVMASQNTKFTVGLFVSCGICIAIAAIVWLGMSRFLQKGQYYVTYFNESVQGLDKDSPVKYRGVSIGRVGSIDVAPDSKLVEVILKIESDLTVEDDMVSQLKSVGITGSMFIELDRRRTGEPDRSPRLTFPTEYPIVASRPSEISELLRGIDDVLGQIRALDLRAISDKIKQTLDSANRLMADADVKGISDGIMSSVTAVQGLLDKDRLDAVLVSLEQAAGSLNNVLKHVRNSIGKANRTLDSVEGLVTGNEESVRLGLDRFRQAMEQANAMLVKVSALADGTDYSLSQLARQLVVTGQNLEKASDNLNRLMELVADQPSQLFFGQPPAPRREEAGSRER